MGLSIQDSGDHLVVQGCHFLSLREVSQHFQELSAALADVRKMNRRVRVLVDLREFPPQSPEVADTIRERTARIYRAHDRVAILVASSILKLQLRRIHADQQFGVFLAEGAAREFLMREAEAATLQ